MHVNGNTSVSYVKPRFPGKIGMVAWKKARQGQGRGGKHAYMMDCGSNNRAGQD